MNYMTYHTLYTIAFKIMRQHKETRNIKQTSIVKPSNINFGKCANTTNAKIKPNTNNVHLEFYGIVCHNLYLKVTLVTR